jgi:hypothetical protein
MARFLLVAFTAWILVDPAFASEDRTSKDWNECKKVCLEEHPESEVKVQKIRGRKIDMTVVTPDGERITVTCFRNDYTLVTKGE